MLVCLCVSERVCWCVCVCFGWCACVSLRAPEQQYQSMVGGMVMDVVVDVRGTRVSETGHCLRRNDVISNLNDIITTVQCKDRTEQERVRATESL